jgi:hypothetical protein
VLAAGSDGETVTVGNEYPDVRSSTRFGWSAGQGEEPGFGFVSDHGGYTEATTVRGSGVSIDYVSDLSGIYRTVELGPVIRVVSGRKFPGPAAIVARGSARSAIVGVAEGTGVQGSGDTGMRGIGGSVAGRGGVFSGGGSQVRLIPARSATHPDSGKAGDLFVDRNKRLWFCKGGAAWVKIA